MLCWCPHMVYTGSHMQGKSLQILEGRPSSTRCKKIGPEAEVLKDTAEIQRHLFLLDISISSEMHCTVDGLRILHQFEWSSWSKPKALYKHTFTVCLLVKLVLIGVWASLRLDQVFGIGTLCMCCWQDYLSYHSLSKSTCPKICNLETIWCLATCSID